MLTISIPCEYSNKTLVIKALGFKAKGDSPDQALLECIKNTVYYTPFILAKFKSYTDFRRRECMHLEVTFDSLIYDKLMQSEPVHVDKLKKTKSSIAEPTPEQMVKLGF